MVKNNHNIANPPTELVRSFNDKRNNKTKRLTWHENELQILRKYYVLLGARYCRWYLQDRSIHAIRHKAIEIGLLRDVKDAWTQPELDVVIAGVVSNSTTSEIFAALRSKGFQRTATAVRDCKLSMIKKFSCV
jgi:hypothetical protein